MGILVALPIAAAISIIDKRKIEEFIFLAIEIIISLIFVTGLLGNTLNGVRIGVIMGGCAAVYCVVMFIIDRERFKASVFTPGAGLALLIIALEGLMLISKTDLGGDNDTYWAHAPQILNMYRYSDLGNVGIKTFNLSLLYTAPVYTSWCYFCNRLWFEYSDGINLWAWQIFILSGFMPLFAFTEKKDWKRQFLIAILILILPGIVTTSYNFMPDKPISAAITYGTIMTICLYRDEKKYNDPAYLLGVCMTLFMVCIMKRIGGMYIFGMIGLASVYTIDRGCVKPIGKDIIKKILPFALMIGAVILTYWFTILRNSISSNFYRGNDYFMISLGGVALFTASGILFKFLKFMIYKKKYLILLLTLFLGFCGTGYIMIKKAMDMTVGSDGDPELVKVIFFKFFEMWFNNEHIVATRGRFENGWVMSDGCYAVILIVAVIIMGVLIAKRKLEYAGTLNDLVNSTGTVVMGYIVYMLFYCFIYMYRQDGYMIGDSHSLFGYTDRYLGPGLLLVTVVVMYELLNIQNINHNKLLICAIVFLMLLIPDNVFKVFSLDSRDYWGEYNKMYADAEVELGEYDKVIFLGPDHGYYCSFPAFASQDMDAYECKTEPEDWSEQIIAGEYNYLILEDYKSEFPDTYASMFDGGIKSIGKMSIYDIVNENGQVKFILK